VHLRFGPVARGGLRWSDRAQDYRTEVLGLVKAQQVKNAVIVPVGAKGGFYPKQLPAGGSRDEVFEAGRAAYITFISTLLSVTDNLEGDTVVPPPSTVRLDGDDPYFVVAADKGTATFSDTANAISQEMGFWLDDAFASGGSAGYDHKKMGITARGGWEAVKRHFREMDKDIQSEPFTVVGVGDMSGDVFGNGMLLSEKIRLVAAFDHRDIFIDPDPDPASSFAERKRVFKLGRSSWQDYDTKKLSKGGGIFPRSQKIISLSQQAADAIGLGKTKASPNEIMTAILKADAELLWFGGIGTYVRGSNETNFDVGDKANDAIRITAKDVGAKVVGEGANLGMTQRARIEYGLHGGRCNSDAIDNSAGVNSSDVEVNIKIALKPAMDDGTLPRPKRNKLLADMTETVAALVLENNYRQTLALSLALGDAVAAMRDGVNKLRAGIQDAIPDFMREEAARTKAELMAHAVPEKLAGEVAALGSTMLAPDICHVAAASGTDLKRAMRTFFSVTEAFRIGRIVAAIDRIPVSDHFEGLALARSLDEISEARRIISSTVLDSNPDAADPAGTWLAGNKDRISHVGSQILSLTDSGELTLAKLTVAAGMMSDLARSLRP
jgi:NAD-specific glutamate dehydrogenase